MEIGGGFHLFALEASNYPLIARAALRRCPERHRAGKMQILLSLVYLFSFRLLHPHPPPPRPTPFPAPNTHTHHFKLALRRKLCHANSVNSTTSELGRMNAATCLIPQREKRHLLRSYQFALPAAAGGAGDSASRRSLIRGDLNRSRGIMAMIF